MSEAVNHPAHYGGSSDPHETIKVIEHLGWGEGFCRGNAIKYLMRAGRKGTATDEAADLRKARWYIDREIARLVALDGSVDVTTTATATTTKGGRRG